MPVHDAIEAYLSAADAAVPGLVTGLYLAGSIPLGDYHPAISDVDLVAVCAERPAAHHVEGLATIHRPSHPDVDVLYVTGDDLAADPQHLSPPHSLAGTFKPDGGFCANPVTWRQLQTAVVPVRGPHLGEGDVWFDPDTLRRWNLANLDDYWARWSSPCSRTRRMSRRGLWRTRTASPAGDRSGYIGGGGRHILTNSCISRTEMSSPKSSLAISARSFGVHPWSLEPWLIRWP